MWHVGEAVSLTFAATCLVVWFMVHAIVDLGQTLVQAYELMDMVKHIRGHIAEIVGSDFWIMISFKVRVAVTSQRLLKIHHICKNFHLSSLMCCPVVCSPSPARLTNEIEKIYGKCMSFCDTSAFLYQF